jgi:2,4-dienoyl-CoA reductase-like NADH-dependent reductase (Old Yellow Enzyme family)
MQNSATLLSPIDLRGVHLSSRIVMSPMCQFSCFEGLANDWHFVHHGSRAIGGPALIFVEATAVTREGRITPGDLGIWDEAHVEPLAKLARVISSYGVVPGIQLAHAGRKASRQVPWKGNSPLSLAEGGWPIVGPSAIAFEDGGPAPHVLTLEEIDQVVDAFETGARRAIAAGFKVIEIHGAHGYLLHQFLSPVSNHRDDEYGGSFENRTRLLMRVVRRLRETIPESMPLFVRISATDWITTEPSWDLDQSVELARLLKAAEVDVVDVSSGAVSLKQKITIEPEYQVPFARRIRAETGVTTAAVGLITEPAQADAIIQRGDADLVFIGRGFLRNPYWGLQAQQELGGDPLWPNPYGSHALRRGMKKDK